MQERLNAKLSGIEGGGNQAPSAPPADMPSAPPMEAAASGAPSAPPALVETFQSNECVVCMENKVTYFHSHRIILFQLENGHREAIQFICSRGGQQTVVVCERVAVLWTFLPLFHSLWESSTYIRSETNFGSSIFQCNIIFLPCGHVCSCHKCEAGISECPLCRATITQKVRLN